VIRFVCGLLLALNAAMVSANPLASIAADGWSSWQVDDPVDAGYRCCFSFDGDKAQAQGCDLDRKQSAFGTSSAAPPASGALTVYVKMTAGKVSALASYDSACPVRANTPVTAMAAVRVEDSVAWLGAQLRGARHLAAPALAALALHPGPAALALLAATASSDSRRQNRHDALFWLGESRGEPGARVIVDLLAAANEDALREHMVFALSRSDWQGKFAQLLDLAKADRSPDIRAKAWFWLAEIDAPDIEREIIAALPGLRSEEEQKGAVFALSQLPTARSVPALIGVVEQKSLPRRVRKDALFWLGQSQSDQAQRYLATVLQ
jgi:hypothetical protein